jgi:hypothetical protein
MLARSVAWSAHKRYLKKKVPTMAVKSKSSKKPTKVSKPAKAAPKKKSAGKK